MHEESYGYRAAHLLMFCQGLRHIYIYIKFKKNTCTAIYNFNVMKVKFFVAGDLFFVAIRALVAIVMLFIYSSVLVS